MAKLPDGWLFTPRMDAKDRTKVIIEETEIVRCRNCKHRMKEIYGTGNVIVSVCDLTHNYAMSDDWYCADGEAKDHE